MVRNGEMNYAFRFQIWRLSVKSLLTPSLLQPSLFYKNTDTYKKKEKGVALLFKKWLY